MSNDKTPFALQMKHEKSAFVSLSDMAELLRKSLVENRLLTPDEGRIAQLTPEWDGTYDEREFIGFKLFVDLTKLDSDAPAADVGRGLRPTTLQPKS